jgi:glycosyltransferase involved in cell wall biosynthesis
VVTVHDLIPLILDQKLSLSARIYWKKILPSSFKTADHLIAISQQTKKDLNYYLKIPLEKISVIYEGASPIFKPEPDENFLQKILARFNLKNTPFILTVGTLEPRKNYLNLIQAFARLKYSDLQLVIVGKKGWHYQPIYQIREQYKLEKRIKLLDYVTEEELMALYNKALFFITVSLYEGFGLPLLEAMACGCPSISSATSSLPEVGGEAVLYGERRFFMLIRMT